MTRFFTIFSVLLTIVSLVSCKSSITKASETVAAFASGVATSDSVTAVKYYPATKDFYSLLPQIGEIEITEAKEVDDRGPADDPEYLFVVPHVFCLKNGIGGYG